MAGADWFRLARARRRELARVGGQRRDRRLPGALGGVSRPPLDSLNLGLSVPDAPEHVLENRRRLCAAIGLPQARLTIPGQVHGSTIAWVGEAEAGRGAFDSPSVIKEHDGLLTRAAASASSSATPTASLSSSSPTGKRGRRSPPSMPAGADDRRARRDCGRRAPAVAARRAASGRASALLLHRRRRAAARFEARFPGSTGAATVDLWRCAGLDLEAAGVPAAPISVAGLCTASDAPLLLHRRDAGARAASG